MNAYIVLYKKGGELKLEDFPNYASASYWQKKYGGYILQEATPDQSRVEPSAIPTDDEE